MSIKAILLAITALPIISCTNVTSELKFELVPVLGSYVDHAGVLNSDTIQIGGWDSSIRPIKFSSDTVIYDCTHYLYSLTTRWCKGIDYSDSIRLNLIEVEGEICHLAKKIWCIENFKFQSSRDTEELHIKSSFQQGDTIFYQSSVWSIIPIIE